MKPPLLNLALLISLTMAPLSAWATNNCQLADTLFKQSQQVADNQQKSSLLKQATGLCPNHRDAHYEFAELQKEQKNWSEATSLYRRVIEIDPNYAPAHAGLGEVLMQQNNYSNAADSFDQYLVLADTDPSLQSQIEKFEARLMEAQDLLIASLNEEQIISSLTTNRIIGPSGVSESVFRAPVRFESNSHQIDPGDKTWKLCEKMANAINKIFAESKFKNSKIRIEGHTDSIGSAHYNEILSERRASSVRDVLINKFGVPSDRLYVIGMGEYHPIANNKTRNGRFLNRRVNLVNVYR